MSLYTRARRHIDMDRVKELREEKIKREQIAKLVQEQEKIRAELEYIEAEESKYINWRSELEEGMNTSGMGMINYPAVGDVNLGAAMSDISLSGDGGLAGYNAITQDSTSSYKQFDTMVVTISTTSSDWVISPAEFILTVGEGGAGNHTVVIPASYSGLYFSAKDDGTFSASVQYQRRAPVNVFVSLDDPDSSAFVRDGDFDRLSNEQKKKKLEEQLKSSEDYLNKMYGEGMPKGATTIADYEPQQSFMDIAAAQQGPIRPGPRGYKKPGTYDPKKFFDLDNKTPMPSPNLPATGPGYSSIPDGTKVARINDQPGDSPAQIRWPRNYYPDKKAPPGPGYKPPIKKAKKQRTMVAHHEPQGKVIKEKKSFKDITKKIPGYYDGKPSPLGFPVEEPPKMKNGFHPDLVDGKKVANRFNRLDPQSAKAMPKTGNPHIDKKVRAAAKKPK